MPCSVSVEPISTTLSTLHKCNIHVLVKLSRSQIHISLFRLSTLFPFSRTKTMINRSVGSLCPECQSAWTLALSLFGEELVQHIGQVLPVQTSCHLALIGLVPALEMEGCSVPLKRVAGPPFAVLRRWVGGWVGGRGRREGGRVVSWLWCGEGSSPKSNQQFFMNPQEHNRSWEGSVMCLLVCVGVCWYVACVVGVVWCGVVWCVSVSSETIAKKKRANTETVKARCPHVISNLS